MKTICFMSGAVILMLNTTPSAQVKSQPNDFPNQDYVLALSTANRFLCAWLMREQEDGLALLSTGLKTKIAEEDLRSCISGLSNPHHEAFEVGPGEQFADGRFAYQVRFYEHYTDKNESFERPKASKIVVVHAGREEWLVDELP